MSVIVSVYTWRLRFGVYRSCLLFLGAAENVENVRIVFVGVMLPNGDNTTGGTPRNAVLDPKSFDTCIFDTRAIYTCQPPRRGRCCRIRTGTLIKMVSLRATFTALTRSIWSPPTQVSSYELSAPNFAKSLVTNSVALYSAVLP